MTPPALPLVVLLAHTRRFVRRFVVLSDEQAIAITLWIAHTYAFPAADTTPYLAINSATKRAGKTRLLEVLELVTLRAWLTGRASPAVLTRKIDAVAPTLLLDESDAAFKIETDYSEALRGVLNSGYKRSGKVSLCVGQGAKITYKDFATFCPKAIAGIGRLPDTVADRAIPIVLKRRMTAEAVERFRERDARREVAALVAQLTGWASSATITRLAESTPALVDALNDRAADVWEPLFAIADLAGESWPAQARAAAVALAGEQRDDQDLPIELLKDIRVIFDELPDGPADLDAVKTAELLEGLNALTERPWPTYGRGEKPLTAHALARLLKDFGIVSAGRLTFPDGRHRGYRRSGFDDAFARYLPIKVSMCPDANESGPELAKTKRPDEDYADTSKTRVSSMNTGLKDTWTHRTPDIGDGGGRDAAWAEADARFKRGWQS